MEKLFGRAYESIGDTSGDLILKTRGNIKVQVGSSFVDLIKGGELNTKVEVIKLASSKDNLPDNGLYLVDNIAYIKYQNTVLPLNDVEGKNYVSYIVLEGITSEQLIQAQLNIGIYYSTVDEAIKTVTSGFAYIKNKGLYNIINSSAYQLLSTDYLTSNVITISELNVSNILKVGNTSLSPTTLTLSDKFQISLNLEELISISNKLCLINNPLIINSIASSNGNLKLYFNNDNGESYLKVDHIICSDSNLEYSPVITKTLYYYPNYNNVIKTIISNSSTDDTEDDVTTVTETTSGYTLELETSFEYKVNDVLHVEYSNTTYDFIVQSVTDNKVIVNLADSTLDPTDIGLKVICYGKPADTTLIGFIIKDNTITYSNDTTKTVFGTLPEGLDYTNGFYSEAAITKKLILIEPSLSNVTFKKSDNFPKLEDGWNLDKEDNSSNIATTKWVKDNAYKLPVATSTVLGGVMIGDGLNITDTGTLSIVDNWTSKLNSLSSSVSSNADEISTLKSLIASLLKAVQDLQDKQSSSTTE